MTAYFDPAETSHTALLPAAVRGFADLSTLAPLIEADVISVYTVNDPSAYVLYNRVATQIGATGRYVFLDGYEEDADDADDAFVLAMRRAIAEVLRWRIHTRNADMDVTAKSDASGASRSYRDDVRDPFPPHWDRWLRQYDTREPAWAF